jgi:DNA modification methylase
MYSISDQINNRRVLIYPEKTNVGRNSNKPFEFNNEKITSTYFPEDIDSSVSDPYFNKVEIGDGNFIYNGDNIQVLKSLPSNSVDSIVTDPPYGLKFMKKQWDYDVPSLELWKECYRVLKPGGYLLSFGSSRTYHRMAVRVEDSGFEIRDQIMWIYGSGFPKSHNVGLSIDKELGHPDRGHRIATASRVHPDGTIEPNGEVIPSYVTKSDEAKPWEGWGLNLKPAHEPIVVARKPISEKNIAKNVLKWNTGGINVDGCRIELHENEDISVQRNGERKLDTLGQGWGFKSVSRGNEGRFPSNIFFDDVAAEILDQQSGIIKTRKKLKGTVSSNTGASKFFYCPKPSKKEKEEGLEIFESTSYKEGNKTRKNTHSTIKPLKLMQYLIRLVTPIGGTTIDIFLGSGTSSKATLREGNYKFIGIEKEKEYFDIAVARCKYEYEESLKLAA